MENVAALRLAIAAIAFVVGAIYFALLGLKELNSARREYSESLDRDEEYQKLAYLRANNLKSIGLFFKAAALLLAPGLAVDVFSSHIFWTYLALIAFTGVVIAWFSEQKIP